MTSPRKVSSAEPVAPSPPAPHAPVVTPRRALSASTPYQEARSAKGRRGSM
jgi:hypothetical protein